MNSLPREVLAEVLAHVGASSSADLFRAKQCCKLFCEAAEDETVYHRASLDKIDIVQWHQDARVSRFTLMCRDCKNPEALYRRGVVDYFMGTNVEEALGCLEETDKAGHAAATYALAIIFLFGENDCKEKGISMLGRMKTSATLKRLVKLGRDRLRSILWMIWVRNPIVLSQRPICCGKQENRLVRSWPVDDSDEEEIIGCACDDELAAICEALPQLML